LNLTHLGFGHTAVVVAAVDMRTRRDMVSSRLALLRRLAAAVVEGKVKLRLYPDNNSGHSLLIPVVVLLGVQMPVAVVVRKDQRDASIRT
jgi:hypothetical protein